MFLPCTEYAVFCLGWLRLAYAINGDAFLCTTDAIDRVFADTRATIAQRAEGS